MAVYIGEPCKRQKTPTIVVVANRGPRSWEVVCFGNKGHYYKDGSCHHTVGFFNCMKSDWHRARTHIVPFGAPSNPGPAPAIGGLEAHGHGA